MAPDPIVFLPILGDCNVLWTTHQPSTSLFPDCLNFITFSSLYFSCLHALPLAKPVSSKTSSLGQPTLSDHNLTFFQLSFAFSPPKPDFSPRRVLWYFNLSFISQDISLVLASSPSQPRLNPITDDLNHFFTNTLIPIVPCLLSYLPSKTAVLTKCQDLLFLLLHHCCCSWLEAITKPWVLAPLQIHGLQPHMGL